MRSVALAALGLMLAACTVPPGGTLQTSGAPAGGTLDRAQGRGPGFYPGLMFPVLAYDRSVYDGFLAQNAAVIQAIRGKEQAIKTGAAEPGCIGHDVPTCIASLARTITLTTSTAMSDLYENEDRVDANGKVLHQRFVHLWAFRPNDRMGLPTAALRIALLLDDQRQVRAVQALLPWSPFAARSVDDYANTGLYEFVAAVGHEGCPDLAPAAVYRFFENDVKPHVRDLGEHRTKEGDDTVISTRYVVNDVAYCGRHFDFETEIGKSTHLAKFPQRYASFSVNRAIVH